MKNVCLPYKERLLDTILCGAKKILRAIHKGITSFFFFISFQFCRRLLVSEWPSNKKKSSFAPASSCCHYRSKLLCLRALSNCQNWPATPEPDQLFWKWNRLFPRVFRLKNVLFRVYYLEFDWSGWRVLIKREPIIATGMVWPVSSDKWKVPKQFPLMTSRASHSKYTDFTLQWGFYYFNLFPQIRLKNKNIWENFQISFF